MFMINRILLLDSISRGNIRRRRGHFFLKVIVNFFFFQRICDNIYIGYGNKNSSTIYSLPAPPSAEYPFGPDVIEGEEPMIELAKNASSQNDSKISDGGDDDAENQ